MIKHWITGFLGVAALASCTSAPAWPPGARGADTEFGQYLTAREAALTGQGPALEQGIVASPAHSPVVVQPQTRRVTQPQTAPPAATPPRRRAELARSQSSKDAGAVLRRYANLLDNNPGEARFPRNKRTRTDARQACSGFASAEAAQLTFIANGGPNVDPLGLDPDGDGYVCGWDPRPLRQPSGG